MEPVETTVYNPQKGRLETIDFVATDDNTTWFDECEDSHNIFAITDWKGCLIIKESDYTYPLWVYDMSRANIDHNHSRARELLSQYDV